MPDLSLVAPLAETIDRRGSEMNAGIGNANTSGLGAFLDGFIKSTADVTAIRGKQMEIQRENDPIKIAAEKVAKELENQQLRATVESLTIDNKTRGRKNDLDIQRIEAEIEAARAKTALSKELSVTSHQQKLVELENKIQSGAIAKSAELRALEKQRYQIIKDDKDRYAKILSSNIPLDEGIKEKAAKELEALNREYPTIPVLDSMESEDGAKAAAVLEYGAVDEHASAPEKEFRIQTRASAVESLDKQRELFLQDTESIKKYKAARDSHDYLYQAQKKKASLQEASKDRSGNIRAGLGDLLEMSQIHRQLSTPQEQAVLQSAMTESIKTLGGSKTLIDYIDQNIPNDDSKAAWKKGVYDILVQAGDTENFTAEQQDLLKVGLSADEIVDTKKTMQDISSLLAGKGADISNNRIKELRNHVYFARARRASNNNTQGFQIYRDGIAASGNESADLAAGQKQSQEVLVFKGADGSEAYGPPPSTDEDKAMWHLLERVGQQSTDQVMSNSQIDATNQTIQSRQANTQRALNRPPAAAQQTPAQETKPLTASEQRQQYLDSNFARLAAEYEQKHGKSLTEAQAKALRNSIRARAGL